MCVSLVCKNVLSLYHLIRSAGVCVYVSHTHTHRADIAVSVGPVRGVAVARLVDLALLLQAAGLATLTRTTLNGRKGEH